MGVFNATSNMLSGYLLPERDNGGKKGVAGCGINTSAVPGTPVRWLESNAESCITNVLPGVPRAGGTINLLIALGVLNGGAGGIWSLGNIEPSVLFKG